jgi:hypothetical protein
MGQIMQQFAQTQQQNWGMGSMNGVGMGGMQNTRESAGVRGGDIGGYRGHNHWHGQQVQGSARRVSGAQPLARTTSARIREVQR